MQQTYTTVECQTMLSLNDIFKLENASKEVESLKSTCEDLKLKLITNGFHKHLPHPAPHKILVAAQGG